MTPGACRHPRAGRRAVGFPRFCPMAGTSSSSCRRPVNRRTPECGSSPSKPASGTKLLDGQSNAVFASPGHLLFWRAGSLWAQPFDPDARTKRGDPVAVEKAVGLNPVTNQALFSISNSGTLAFFGGRGRAVGARVGRSKRQRDRESWRDRSDEYDFVVARCRERRLRQRRSHDRHVRSLAARLCAAPTPRSSRSTRPTISFRSGRQMEHGSRSHRFVNARRRCTNNAANSAGTETLLVRTKLPTVATGWSRDGARLFYTVTEPVNWTGDIWSVSSGSSAPQPVVTTTERRPLRDAVTRRPLAGLCHQRVRNIRSDRAGLSAARLPSSSVVERRLPAAVARRRRRAFLYGARQNAHVGGVRVPADHVCRRNRKGAVRNSNEGVGGSRYVEELCRCARWPAIPRGKRDRGVAIGSRLRSSSTALSADTVIARITGPGLLRTPIIRRRGSMKMIGRPKFELNRTSVARASSAVSLSRFRTSASKSTRPSPRR